MNNSGVSQLCAKILEKAIVPKTFIYITYLSYTISAPKIQYFLQLTTDIDDQMCCILPRFQIQNRKHEVILRKPGSLHGQQVTLEKLDGFHSGMWTAFRCGLHVGVSTNGCTQKAGWFINNGTSD